MSHIRIEINPEDWASINMNWHIGEEKATVKQQINGISRLDYRYETTPEKAWGQIGQIFRNSDRLKFVILAGREEVEERFSSPEELERIKNGRNENLRQSVYQTLHDYLSMQRATDYDANIEIWKFAVKNNAIVHSTIELLKKKRRELLVENEDLLYESITSMIENHDSFLEFVDEVKKNAGV